MRYTILLILTTYLSNGILPIYSIVQENENINPNATEQNYYIEERFPNGHHVGTLYNSEQQPTRIQISDIGEIVYEYLNGKISKIHRLDKNKVILYTYAYLSNRKESMIGNLGLIEQTFDNFTYTCTTPYSIETCKYDENRNIIERIVDDEIILYSYDEKNRLLYKDITSQENLFEHDQPLLVYDEQGNLIQKQNIKYSYDIDNRLIEVNTEDSRIFFAYDDQNRRISKRVESETEFYEQTYLYYKNIPIAIFKNGKLEQLSIPNYSGFNTIARAIAIETPNAIYAPIYDIQWNICKLINIKTKKIYPYAIDPFGKNINQHPLLTPWLFCTKEYDPETNLIYFGHRYYDPSIQKWLTRDPLPQDINNLYTYCFNNPLRYMDPDGRFTIVIPLIDLTLGVLGKAIVKGLLFGSAAWLGAKGVKKTDEYIKEKEKQKRLEENKRAKEI